MGLTDVADNIEKAALSVRFQVRAERRLTD